MHVPPPRRIARPRIAVLAVAIALSIVGCSAQVGGQPTVDPTQTPQAQADDDLAIATYRQYAGALDSTDFSDPGLLTLIETLTAEPLRSTEQESFERNKADGITFVGKIEVMSITVVERTSEPIGLVLLVCQDYSNTDVIDASGTSIVDGERPDRQLLEAVMVRTANDKYQVSDVYGSVRTDPC